MWTRENIQVNMMMSCKLVWLLLLPLVAMQDLPDDLDALEPKVEADETGGQCVCRLSGEWTEHTEYAVLQHIRHQLVALDRRVEQLDYTKIHTSMGEITSKLEGLESRINTQSVDVTTKELIDLRKTVDVLHALVTSLQVNASSTAVSAVQAELDTLVAHVDDLWKKNPYGSGDEMNKELDALKAKLQGCKEQFGTLGSSFFPGDTAPIVNRLDTDWCRNHEIVAVGEAITHRYIGATVGTWVKDPYPVNESSRGLVFYRDNTYNGIYIYSNYTNFITNTDPTKIALGYVNGVGTTVYNGSFYWYYNGNIYRKDQEGKNINIKTDQVNTDYLESGTATYVDLKADETGLWGIWSTQANNNKVVLHEHDPTTLNVRRAIRTNKLKTSMCMSFMACGRFYALDVCKVRLPPSAGVHRQYVYNTMTREEKYLPLHVSSKFGHIQSLAYFARDKVLLGWDKGHAVSFPLQWRNTETGELEAPPALSAP